MLVSLKKYWWVILLVIAVAGVWFLKSGYIFATDLSWGPNPKIDLELSHGTILQIFSWLGEIVSQPISEKILLTLPLVIAATAGHKMGGNAVATLAIFNPFVYNRLMVGQFNVLLSYAFLLCIVCIFKKWINLNQYKKIEVRDIYLVSILFSLAVLASIHSIFIIGFLLVFMLVIFYKNIYKYIFESKMNLKNLSKFVLIFFIPLITINSVWVYKMLTAEKSVTTLVSNVTDQDFEAFATYGDSFVARTWNVLNMQGFWADRTHNYITIADKPLSIMLTIIIWATSIIGAIYLYKNNKKVFYVVIFIIFSCIILAQATTIPFIKNILYGIPFYSGLREPQKWVALLMSMILLLISFALDKYKHKVWMVVAISISSILWTPYLLYGGWNQIAVREYPDYYRDIDNKLSSYDCYGGTTVVMPWHKYIEYNWVKRIVDNPAGFYFDCPVITGTNMEIGQIYDNSNSNEGKRISAYVLSGGGTKLPENIAAILLFKDADYKKYDFLQKYNIIEDNNNYTLYRVK